MDLVGHVHTAGPARLSPTPTTRRPHRPASHWQSLRCPLAPDRATSRSPTISRRYSAPETICSTSTSPSRRPPGHTPPVPRPASRGSRGSPAGCCRRRGRSTTGKPSSWAAAQASSARWPVGRRGPARRRPEQGAGQLVVAGDGVGVVLVRSVCALPERCCPPPWPSWTSPSAPSGERDAPLAGGFEDGGRGRRGATWSASRASFSTSAATSNGWSWTAARQSARPLPGRPGPAPRRSYSIDHLVDAVLGGLGSGRSRRRCRQGLQFERRRARGCGRGRCRAAAARRSRRVRRRCNGARSCWAARLMSRSLKPGSSSEGESLKGPRSTQASRTGKLAQMFGPRRATHFPEFHAVSFRA